MCNVKHLFIPKKYWTGINHDFLRPNLRINKESTNGAHKSFKLNGHTAKLNLAYSYHKCFYYFIIQF